MSDVARAQFAKEIGDSDTTNLVRFLRAATAG
jgi:hypothetical protein